jgi:hypothetical protein
VGRDSSLLGGARSRELVQYLPNGQVQKSLLPYRAGEKPYWVSYTYDDIGRVIEEDAPISENETEESGAITVYEYPGHTLRLGKTLTRSG